MDVIDRNLRISHGQSFISLRVKFLSIFGTSKFIVINLLIILIPSRERNEEEIECGEIHLQMV